MRANLFPEKVSKKFTVKKDPGIRERENPGIHIPAAADFISSRYTDPVWIVTL
jgi:hypothetical protein